MPRFLDFELDEQQRSSLLQAWMCSRPSDSSQVPHGAAQSHSSHLPGRNVVFVTSINLICSSGSEAPVAIDSAANLIFGGEPNFLLDFYGQATAKSLLTAPEAESAFIENERVITFRPALPDARRAHQLTNLSLSPDAARFAARARGRRLRPEEDPELQSE